MDGGPAESLRGVCGIEPVLATGLVLKEPTTLGPGELSGERDGKDTKDLAELGVTSDCLRDLERTVPGRWEVELVDTVEDLRSRRLSRSLAMAKGQKLKCLEAGGRRHVSCE